MGGLPRSSGHELIQALARVGFRTVSIRGSHAKLRGTIDGRERTVIVPLHAELAPGTPRSIIRQSGLSREAFLALLREDI